MLKRKSIYAWISVLMVSISGFCMDTMNGDEVRTPQKLRIGTTISVFGGLEGLTYENLKEARSAGISDIEISLTGLVNGDHPIPNAELKEKFRRVKHDADCDPSHVDETIRSHSENAYRGYIDVVGVLEPEVILFHPSWRLGLNERKQRMSQLVKTITSLNKDVKETGAIIVLENLLGYKLLRSPGVERPLGRTVEEMVEIMDLMPADVYAAIDMNHIKNPERLIAALGSRIKSVHIADGDGEKECHQLPGRGKNNWTLILQALDRAGYTGPFLYEIRAKEVNGFTDLVATYHRIYEDYIRSLQP